MTGSGAPKPAGQGPLAGVPTVTAISAQQTITIVKRMGGGTQGDVYLATMGAQRLAVKWYLPLYRAVDRQLRHRLERLIAIGPPGPRFIWPQDVVEQPGVPGFGYVMPWIEPPFVSLEQFAKGKVDPSFRTLATLGCEIAKGFLDLHARGLSYCDINFGNIWFDPQTGDTLICDNDNVDVNGVTGAIAGSPRFMAPEIVREEAGPSIATDLHSLAVLLFWTLMMHHPLEGRREAEQMFPTPEDRRAIFGTRPLFIFDPADDSNAPIPGEQDAPLVFWPMYPAFLRTLFTQAFTRGLHDPHARVMESAWRRAMARLRDCILTCHSCGVEAFFDPDAETAQPCWQCSTARGPVMVLKLTRAEVVMAPGAVLYDHHLAPGREFDFAKPMAQVVTHPKHPGLFGLQNLTPEEWIATDENGNAAVIGQDRSVQVSAGLTIDFGPAVGTVGLR